MRRGVSAALFLLLLTPFACGQAVVDKMFPPGLIRVLMLSGRNNHDWRTTTPYLRQILESTGRFVVRVNEEPAGLDAAALQPYHVLVLDYNGPRWSPATERAVEEFVRGGKGMVGLHAAVYGFGRMPVLGDRHVSVGVTEPPWTEFAKMIGGTWEKDPPPSGHGRRHVFRVKWTDRAHPIAAGLDESFLISDELYHNQRTQAGVRVIATAYDDPAQKGTGKDEPMIWTVSYGKGRSVFSALGHDVAAMQAPGYQVSFARAVEWAATGQVSLPPVISLDQPEPGAVRAMVVTGGHDYAPSFPAMFEGRRDVRVMINPHPVAFRGDLAKRCDVLVFYDMAQSVPEEQQRNLVRFAESGKGIVVLHHSVATFNDWDWWKELTGVRYLLKPAGGMPASTYKHDVALIARPVADHPVVKGVPPMYILDETYKGMWFSPDNQVLMTTDEASSDGPLVWISPYRKSRVVVIQLGHGSEAHRHPHYQQLVFNAIRWAGEPRDGAPGASSGASR
jgi:type 1 glutamine amidotransferase